MQIRYIAAIVFFTLVARTSRCEDNERIVLPEYSLKMEITDLNLFTPNFIKNGEWGNIDSIDSTNNLTYNEIYLGMKEIFKDRGDLYFLPLGNGLIVISDFYLAYHGKSYAIKANSASELSGFKKKVRIPIAEYFVRIMKKSISPSRTYNSFIFVFSDSGIDYLDYEEKRLFILKENAKYDLKGFALLNQKTSSKLTCTLLVYQFNEQLFEKNEFNKNNVLIIQEKNEILKLIEMFIPKLKIR